MTVLFRPADRDDDRAFIVDGWISSYRTAHAAGLIPMTGPHAWHKTMWPIVEGIIDRPYVRTLVACDKADPDFLYGFISCEPDLPTPYVHYVYTKEPFRRAEGTVLEVGVARGLFRAVGIDPARPFGHACKTPVLTRLAHKIPCARWDPLYARFGRRDDDDERKTTP